MGLYPGFRVPPIVPLVSTTWITPENSDLCIWQTYFFSHHFGTWIDCSSYVLPEKKPKQLQRMSLMSLIIRQWLWRNDICLKGLSQPCCEIWMPCFSLWQCMSQPLQPTAPPGSEHLQRNLGCECHRTQRRHCLLCLPQWLHKCLRMEIRMPVWMPSACVPWLCPFILAKRLYSVGAVLGLRITAQILRSILNLSSFLLLRQPTCLGLKDSGMQMKITLSLEIWQLGELRSTVGSPGWGYWGLMTGVRQRNLKARIKLWPFRAALYLEVAFGALLSAQLVVEREHGQDTLGLLKRLKCHSSPCFFAYHRQVMSFLLALLKLYKRDFNFPPL